MIYAIGDVHGEAEALERLLDRLPLESSDLVIWLGDLIDREGDDPFRCVQLVIDFDRCRKVCLHGNHEDSLRDYMEFGDPEGLDGMDADNTLVSYERAGYPIRPGDPATIPQSHALFYFSGYPWTLPYYITERYIFTHAGWNLDRLVERQNLHNLHWGRVTGVEERVWEQTVVRGHVPVPEVRKARLHGYIGIDTGCGLGGALTALALPSMKVFREFPSSYREGWINSVS